MNHHAILTELGTARLDVLAARHGTTAHAVHNFLKNKAGVSLKYELTRSEGMGIADVARALGVTDKAVYDWVRRKRLKARRVPGFRRVYYYSINADAVTDMLRGGVALEPSIKPTALAWREIVDEIRADLRARWVTTDELTEALQLHNLAYIRQRHGFPAPTYGRRGHMHHYDRAAVRAWLDAHPQYRTRATDDLFRAA